MRIGIDARLYGLEHAGIGRYVMELVKKLQVLDQKNDYILFLRQDDYRQLNSLPSNWYKVLADIRHYTLKEQFSLAGIIKSAQVDLIHFPHFNVPLLYHQPYVVTIHDLLWHQVKGPSVTTLSPLMYFIKYGGYRLVVNHALKSSQHIFVPSHWVRRQLIDKFHLPPFKISVTYEGIAASFSQKANSQASKLLLKKLKITPPFLVYTGSAYPHKNLRLLIRAIKQLKHQSIPIQLVIVSARSAFLADLKGFVARQGLKSNQVNFVGFLTDQQLRLLYSTASALVHPSLSEGFGLTGLEAMAANLPVIASQAGSLPEIYQGAALYFDPHNVQDLTSKISTLLSRPRLAKALRSKGKKLIKEYNWTYTAQQTLKVYQKFIKP